ILIAQIQPSIRHHRMRPAILFCPIRWVEPAMLLVAGWGSLNQGHCSRLVLLPQIEPLIGIDERTLAEPFFVLPFGLPGFEILSGPAFRIRIAIDITPNLHGATMVIDHYFIRVNPLRSERSVCR